MVAENFYEDDESFQYPKEFCIGMLLNGLNGLIHAMWNEETKVAKLPTSLGEALVTWLELSEDEQKDYNAVKEKDY